MERRRLLVLDPSKCTGCEICMLWCSYQKERLVGRTLARLRLENTSDLQRVSMTTCLHCENPICIKTCRFGALIQSDENGIVGIDKQLCTGCGDCASSCPAGGITISRCSTGKRLAQKCDLCGGDPVCVQVCPTQAISLAEVRLSGQRKTTNPFC